MKKFNLICDGVLFASVAYLGYTLVINGIKLMGKAGEN